MNLFAFLTRPERETNLRLVLAELDAMKRKADRMLADCPPWDGTERRASERIGDRNDP